MKNFLFSVCLPFLLASCGPSTHAPEPPHYATEVGPQTPLFYVALAGDDAATGSMEQPLATVAEALRRAEGREGAVIRLAPGVYRERVKITSRATALAPLVIEGARNAKGESVSVLDGSRLLDADQWQARPDLGPGVYAYPEGDPRLILVDDKSVARLHPEADHKRYRNTEVLAWAEDHHVEHRKKAVPFWETLGGVYTPGEGEFYLRLRGGANPAEHVVAMAPEGATIAINGGSHVVLRNLIIKGGQHGVEIGGKEALGNRVEGCFIPHGRRRIDLSADATQTVIRNNRLEMGFIGNATGAWAQEGAVLSPEESAEASRKAFVYHFFKYWASASTVSDDVSIAIGRGSSDTHIEGNTLDGGLIGIKINEPLGEVRVVENVIRNFSSVGTAVSRGGYRVIYDGNLSSNCGINLRLHGLNESGFEPREIYIVGNTSIEPKGLGQHIFCHFTHVTEQSPQHRIVVANNTFLGGLRALKLPPAKRAEQALRGFQVLNNTFIGCGTLISANAVTTQGHDMFGVFDYNRIEGVTFSSHGRPVWFGAHNVVEANITPGWQWDANGFRAPAGWSRPEIDLSRPYRIGGREYPALPGLFDSLTSSAAAYVD